MIFAETDELNQVELVAYHIQHAFAAHIAPALIFSAGRFQPSQCMKFPLGITGLVLFCLYMRYILTPMAFLTWANLNHTLCG
jgi:hypothetical protein